MLVLVVVASKISNELSTGSSIAESVTVTLVGSFQTLRNHPFPRDRGSVPDVLGKSASGPVLCLTS